jgi:hypothetical protein
MNQNDFKFKQAREFEREGKFLHAIQLYHSLLNEELINFAQGF